MAKKKPRGKISLCGRTLITKKKIDMCSPIQSLPSYKEPLPCYPCIPVRGPRCLPCGMDPVTVRRPLIVHDSTFDYRPTSWPGMVLNNQDKKVRYQLINYERPVKPHYPSCSPHYAHPC